MYVRFKALVYPIVESILESTKPHNPFYFNYDEHDGYSIIMAGLTFGYAFFGYVTFL